MACPRRFCFGCAARSPQVAGESPLSHERTPHPRPADAGHLAWNRVCGILSGVVLILLLSIVVLPKSASMECIRECVGC